MRKITGFYRLIRFELPFSAGICVIMGQMLALGKFATLDILFYGFFAVFSISASILVLNDYFDVQTDMINAPHRPIPSGQVSRSEALFFSLALLSCAMFFSYLLNQTALLCAIVLLLIGFMYNRFFKKSGLAGNLMVSISVGMTFIYGGLSVGQPFNKMAWFFAVIAALVDLGEEIAADAMDMDGDRLIDSKSLAIRFGAKTALKTSSTVFLCVIILSFLPFLFGWFATLYLIPILLMDGFIAWCAIKMLRSQDQLGRKYIRMLYLGATAGLIIFISMRFLGL